MLTRPGGDVCTLTALTAMLTSSCTLLLQRVHTELSTSQSHALTESQKA